MAGEALTKAYESAHADKAQTPSGMSKLDQALMEANTARQQETANESTAADKGQKFDNDKPDMSLLSPIALVLLTKVLDFGAKKYAKHNWRKGISEDRLVAASLRHITAILGGEVCDRETGLPHAAHLMCEAMFLCEQYTSQAGAPVSYQYSEAQLDLLADLLAGKPYEI